MFSRSRPKSEIRPRSWGVCAIKMWVNKGILKLMTVKDFTTCKFGFLLTMTHRHAPFCVLYYCKHFVFFNQIGHAPVDSGKRGPWVLKSLFSWISFTEIFENMSLLVVNDVHAHASNVFLCSDIFLCNSMQWRYSMHWCHSNEFHYVSTAVMD